MTSQTPEQSGTPTPPEEKRVKYVWMIAGSPNPCDIRRYAYTHRQAVGQLRHVQKTKFGYRDYAYPKTGIWELYKLVRVNKRRAK